jgi:hypothetical protein
MDFEQTRDEAKAQPKKSRKSKTYATPQLQVYGNLQEITGTVKTTGKRTDPGHITPRTH